MGFWLNWNVEDNVKMQVFADNAAAANRESLCSGSRESPVPVRHGTKRKLEETEEVKDTNGPKCICRNSREVYFDTRQHIYNVSMSKLGSFRQTLDPSLRRSVVICNTLRAIEREMVSEGLSPRPPVTLLPSIETDKMTLDPIPNTTTDCYPAATTSSYIGAAGNVVSAVETVSCRDCCELGYEKSLTDLDSISGRATPYPSINNSSNNEDLNQSRSPCDREMWAPAIDNSSSSSSAAMVTASSSSSSSAVSERAHVSTNTISWSNVLCFPGQNEMVTTNSSEDVWPSNGAYFDHEANGSGSGPESGGPNTSPSASSDSGISTASDEIFGDIDLSLYDFDLLPMSPPSSRAPSAEELLRSFPPTGQSIQLTAPVSTTSYAISTMLPSNSHSRHTRSYEGVPEEFDHVMHAMPAPP